MKGNYYSAEDIVRFARDKKVKETGAYSKGQNDGLNIIISALLSNCAIPPCQSRPSDSRKMDRRRRRNPDLLKLRRGALLGRIPSHLLRLLRGSHGSDGGLTMADYIRRDYALHNIECGPWDTETDRNRAIHYVRELTPAANVRPVVRGKWEIDNSYAGPGLMNLRCSVCGEFGGTWRDCTLPSMLYKFCPNCGAEMKPNLDTTKGDDHD